MAGFGGKPAPAGYKGPTAATKSASLELGIPYRVPTTQAPSGNTETGNNRYVSNISNNNSTVTVTKTDTTPKYAYKDPYATPKKPYGNDITPQDLFDAVNNIGQNTEPKKPWYDNSFTRFFGSIPIKITDGIEVVEDKVEETKEFIESMKDFKTYGVLAGVILLFVFIFKKL